MNNPFRILSIILLLVSFDIGCSNRPKELIQFSASHQLMGTVINLKVCYESKDIIRLNDATKEVVRRLEDISWRMNVYDPKSDISKINEAFVHPVEVGVDTFNLIKEAKQYNISTAGAFDITVWPLIQLWREYENKDILPDSQTVNKRRELIGIDKVLLYGDNFVQLANDVVKIDLGGIAKGYGVDDAIAIYARHGFKNVYVDAGGDIYAAGKNCKGMAWRIGIRDPRYKDKLINIVEIEDAAVTTSGNYEQYLTIEGQRFSHIINPSTGYPQREVVSATVIASSALEADVFSTAISVLGFKQGLEFLNENKKLDAILVLRKDGKNAIKREASKNFANYQIK